MTSRGTPVPERAGMTARLRSHWPARAGENGAGPEGQAQPACTWTAWRQTPQIPYGYGKLPTDDEIYGILVLGCVACDGGKRNLLV